MNSVLVVDDELIIRTGIQKMVEQYPGAKLDVHTASNGVEALDILSNRAIQVVITDIRMPKMDGLTLCKNIIKQFPKTQLMVVSGYDDFSYAKQAMRFGVRDYLLKPVLPPDLYEVFDKIINERQAEPNMVSLSMYESWMDLIEETMWKLDRQRIPDVLEQWKDHCKKLDIRPRQLAKLLQDCLENIRKRMAKRSFDAKVGFAEDMEAWTSENMMKHFEAQILSMMDQLASMRGAKFRNPFDEAKQYIDTHLSEEITLDEIAQRVGMSPTYFSHLFKKETDETFVQYRIRKRMEKARALMEQPHHRIIDICQAVGYTDYPHFTKTFKKFSGYSPSEYRAKMGID